MLRTVNDGGSTSNTTVVANDLAATSPTFPSESIVWRAGTTGTYYVGVKSGSTSTTTDFGSSSSGSARGPLTTRISPTTAFCLPVW